jgi:hypothetical protein
MRGSILVLSAPLLALGACQGAAAVQGLQQHAAECSIGSLLAVAETTGSSEMPLRFMACPLKAEIKIGEPVRVLVLLQNTSPAPILVRARFEPGDGLYGKYTGPDGRTPSHSGSWEPGHVSARLTWILLPRAGVVGRIIGLDCRLNDFFEIPTTWEDCDPFLSFEDEGLYTISLAYEVECPLWGCPPDYPWAGRLEAPPIYIRVVSAS